MQIIQVNAHNLERVQQNSVRAVMALGFFDGVHRGHQHVIQTAKKQANELGLPLAIMSFFPHPKTVFSNDEIDYLMPLEEKAKNLAALGVDVFYIVEFTKQFAALSPKDFILQYVVGLNITHAVAGYDYTYGAKGAGTVYTIKKHSASRLTVSVIEKVNLNGDKVSSTCIRAHLKRGQVEYVSALLGKPYSVQVCPAGKLQPYFTLPKPGHYYVTIIVAKRAISKVIEVYDQANLQLPLMDSKQCCKVLFHSKASARYSEIS